MNLGGWCAKSDLADQPQYLQVLLDREWALIAVATQGIQSMQSWVSEYYLSTSLDRQIWVFAHDFNGKKVNEKIALGSLSNYNNEREKKKKTSQICIFNNECIYYCPYKICVKLVFDCPWGHWRNLYCLYKMKQIHWLLYESTHSD